jgi:hypothetical protein
VTGKQRPPIEPAETEETSVPRWVLPAIIIATLTVGGWFIIQNLAATSKMEDCTMSGRRNCVQPIDTSKLGR